MQLRLDAADRLVELVEERRGPVRRRRGRAATVRAAPGSRRRSRARCSADVVDTDARLAWRGDAVALAEAPGAGLLLEEATYVVVDLETTGLRPGSSQICEIGAVRVQGLELGGGLRDARGSRDAAHSGRRRRLTGLTDGQLRGAPQAATRRPQLPRRSPATRCSSRTTRASTSPSSTARLERLTGSRIAAAGRRHRAARAAPARGPRPAREPRLSSRTSSARRRSRATGRSRTRRRRPRSCSR